MKRAATLLLVLASVTLTLAPLARAAVGTHASGFTLPAAPGGPSRGRFRLDDHLGQRPIILLFWATWCQPCQIELQTYQQLAARYTDQLTVVGISMDNPDQLSEVGPLARHLDITFPIVTDLETQVVAVYNPRRAAPFSVWIDRSGTIRREREGFNLADRPVLEADLARFVAGQPIH